MLEKFIDCWKESTYCENSGCRNRGSTGKNIADDCAFAFA